MKWKTGGSKRESESGNKKGFWCFAFNMTVYSLSNGYEERFWKITFIWVEWPVNKFYITFSVLKGKFCPILIFIKTDCVFYTLILDDTWIFPHTLVFLIFLVLSKKEEQKELLLGKIMTWRIFMKQPAGWGWNFNMVLCKVRTLWGI